jgi:cell division protein FtsI/penicillin-binding protein 2
MKNKLLIKRALLLLIFISLAFTGLGYRLVDLQVLRHDEFAKLEDENSLRAYWQAPRRGQIVDINNNPLATTVTVNTVCADPTLIGDQADAVAQVLAQWLPVSRAALVEKLTPRKSIARDEQGGLSTNDLHYVRLARDIPDVTWQKIHSALTNLDSGLDEQKLSRSDRTRFALLRQYGVFTETEQRRNYPSGSLAAQVIGFCGQEEKKETGKDITQMVGRDGIELTMNADLTGIPGYRVTGIAHSQREMLTLRGENMVARDGLDVALTIDSGVQLILENALAEAMKSHTPKSVAGIVIRPATGEILAMATMPNYDPNRTETITPETRNRVITDIMEPGSTFKIVVVSGALNIGIVKLTDQFYCENGHFSFAGHVLHDHEPFGMLTTEGIITKSSNIGAAKIGIRLGEQNLYDYACNYGFGQRTGISLPGEARGFLYPVKDWSKVSIAQIPMGHGVAVTRLQMAMAMGAIANAGRLMRPMIISRLQDQGGRVVQRYLPQQVRQVVSEETCREMIEALKTVVTKDGTAEGAAMKDYVVAGKTGTAQKAENGAYVPGKYISSFIGFFPADKPELLISIVMDEPKEGYYGGKVCGPVFKEVAESCASYLNIPPDPQLMTNQSPIMAEVQPRNRSMQ